MNTTKPHADDDNHNLLKKFITRLLIHLNTAPSPVREYKSVDHILSYMKPLPSGEHSFIEEVKKSFSILLEDLGRLENLAPLELPKLHLSPEPRLFKVCLIGDGAVGKTSLRRKYVGQAFNENYIPTIGADFSFVELAMNDYHTQMTIWDLAGQPKFQTVKGAYFVGSMGAVVVFDVTRITTFFNTFFWIDSLYRYVKGVRPIVFLANKIDLEDQMDPSMFMVDQLILYFQHFLYEQYGITSSYLKTSAKTGENVQQAFREMMRHVLLWVQDNRC